MLNIENVSDTLYVFSSNAVVHTKFVSCSSAYISCQLKWCIQKLTTAIVHTKVIYCNSANMNQKL